MRTCRMQLCVLSQLTGSASAALACQTSRSLQQRVHIFGLGNSFAHSILVSCVYARPLEQNVEDPESEIDQLVPLQLRQRCGLHLMG